MILENIQKNITVKPEAKITNLIVEEKTFSLETVFGENENVSHIQGIPVSGAIPQENQTLVFNGIQWVPAFLNKNYSITLTEEDIQRGYAYLPSATGSMGEKNYIELIPEGAPVQEYGKDFTVMNSDNNQHLVLILGNEVSGIDPEVLSRANSVLHIPMAGSKTSLNVAVTAGIGLYLIIKSIGSDPHCVENSGTIAATLNEDE